MKSYRYKSPIINLISILGLLICCYFFVRMLFVSTVSLWVKIICFFLFALLFSLCAIIGYIFITNIKPKYIRLEENRIFIPDIFSTSYYYTIYYVDINVLKILSDYNSIFSLYGGAIYIATDERNGYIREIFIERIWMKNKSEYLELFKLVQEKINR